MLSRLVICCLFTAIESELKRARDVDAQKLNLVRRVDKHTYEAIMWLRQHKSEFQDMIYEPPLMTVRRERGKLCNQG